MKIRYSELDIMKGIGILFVYLGHSFNINGLEKKDYFIYFFRLAYSFHMPLFFFISGLLSNSNKDIVLGKFYKNKIKRLLIPYLFINFIDFFPRTIFPNLVNSKFGGIKEIIFYGTKISWFVYTLFIIFMIFPFLDKYILKKDKYYIFGFVLLIINYFKIFNEVEVLSLNAVFGYLIYFYIGYILKPMYDKIKNGIITENSFFIVIGIVFLFFSYKYYYLSLFNSIFFAMIGIFFTLNLSLRISEGNKIFNILNFYGVNSIIFYLLEGFITVVTRVILLRIIPLKYLNLFVILFFLIRIIGAYLIIKFIILKNNILLFLFGENINKTREN